jgi:SPP1 gp7 family putative phage head morphogenesis protein
MELNKLYEQMYLQISLDNEAFMDKQMKKVYKEIKKAMNDTISNITNIFVNHAVDGKLNLTSTQKADVRRQTSEYLKKMGKSSAESEVEQLTTILEDIAKETYYKTAYVMSYGSTILLKFPLIRQEFINSIVNAEFKGEMFSSRIWKNKDSLIKKLRLEIEDAMKGNKTVDQVARNIKKEFAVKTYQASRIARTETARVQVQAQEEIGKNVGAKWVTWLATLDKKTNPEDAALDGKRWRIDEEHPKPPLHPNCRCVLINVPNEDWQPKKRKDNETKQIIDYQDYNSWLKTKGIE